MPRRDRIQGEPDMSIATCVCQAGQHAPCALFARSTRKCEKCPSLPRGQWGECWCSGTQGQPAEFCQEQHGAVLMKLKGMKGGWTAGLVRVPQGSTSGLRPEINGVWKNTFPYRVILLKENIISQTLVACPARSTLLVHCLSCLEESDFGESCECLVYRGV